mmetsp:Transcript_6430/g.18399  ORF Transcript_6430/g.18399 Transcript_6430/m.18399 type:complete len:209 (+) Transcript_6430:895-1521(+)
MSENTMSVGTSSRASRCSRQTSRICSYAASKLVSAPHGARSSDCTFFTMLSPSFSLCHWGCVSKVRTMFRNAGWVISEIPMPMAIETSMGLPDMEPETSERGTIFERSNSMFSSLACASTCSTTFFHRSFHCASRTFSRIGLTFPFMISATISSGIRAPPFNPSRVRWSTNISAHFWRLASLGRRTEPRAVSFRSALDSFRVALEANM